MGVPHCAVLDNDAGKGDQGATSAVVKGSRHNSKVLDAGKGDQEATSAVVKGSRHTSKVLDAGKRDQGAAAVVSELQCAVLSCDTGKGDQ